MRLVVMVSGSGSNLQAIMDAIATGTLQAEIVGVISNRKEAFALERAAKAGIPTLYFPLKPYKEGGKSREAYDSDLALKVAAFQPDLIVLAGWMHILSAAFLHHFPLRVINLHPALPGAFPGTDAIHRAYEAAQDRLIDESGCMVHYAIPEVDAGDVLAKAVVPIYPEDSLEAFEARIHKTEHILIVEAIKVWAGQHPR